MSGRRKRTVYSIDIKRKQAISGGIAGQPLHDNGYPPEKQKERVS